MNDPLELRDLHVQGALAHLTRRLRAKVLEDRLLELGVVWLLHRSYFTHGLGCRWRPVDPVVSPGNRSMIRRRKPSRARTQGARVLEKVRGRPRTQPCDGLQPSEACSYFPERPLGTGVSCAHPPLQSG